MIDKKLTESFACFLKDEGQDVTLQPDGWVRVPGGAENGEDAIVAVERKAEAS